MGVLTQWKARQISILAGTVLIAAAIQAAGFLTGRTALGAVVATAGVVLFLALVVRLVGVTVRQQEVEARFSRSSATRPTS